MNPYYFIIEAEPQHGNPIGAHVSRAIVHVWLLSTGIEEARAKALSFLAADLWEVLEEKEASVLTAEQIDSLGDDDVLSYQAAKSEGIYATFNYWHK